MRTRHSPSPPRGGGQGEGLIYYTEAVLKTQYDLSQLSWKLAGTTPHSWRMMPNEEHLCATPYSDLAAIPAKVPGSVQQSLLDAGRLPDWNKGLNSLQCEWVEHRHWVYEATLPDEWVQSGRTYRLNCLGLDDRGWVYVNTKLVADFNGAFTPYTFDITPYLREKENIVRIIFDMPPQWLGYTGFTSKFTDWKARFSYSWDWMVRFVPIGVWDSIYLEATDWKEIRDLRCVADADVATSTGSLKLTGNAAADEGSTVKVVLAKDGATVREETVPASQFTAVGISWTGLPVELWWPNLMGEHQLYTVKCTLLGRDGKEQDSVTRRVGFRNISWAPCEGAPAEADPWLCVVNGKPVFLQGVNWTPIRPNFADLTEADYRKRLELYRDLGMNIMRVWGGAILEKEVFYNLCDELGIMVWQEFSLSSSSFDNWPPEDPKAVREMAEIAKSYIVRRQHHPSLIIWCGGNELHKKVTEDGEIIPVAATLDHPMLASFKKVVEENDPGRRFIATSPTGPRLGGDVKDYGKGVHWDVHGPWMPGGKLDEEWTEMWQGDDSLFRSEVGSPSASPVEILSQYACECGFVQPSQDAPDWRRPFDFWWWGEQPKFVEEKGRQPESTAEYVAWSQERQAKALSIAAKACKGRFPGCGGFIIWMGQDCFPCTANTAIVDFHGDPKPAAIAVGRVFRGELRD